MSLWMLLSIVKGRHIDTPGKLSKVTAVTFKENILIY